MKTNNSHMDLRKLAIILVSCVLAVSIVCFIVLLVVMNLPEEVHTSATPDTAITESAPMTLSTEDVSSGAATEITANENETTVTTGNLTEAQTKPMTANVPLPEKLDTILTETGNSAETLAELEIGQLVVVASSGTTAEISMYERTAEGWIENSNLNCTGYVGIEGTVSEMSEQVSGTPVGLYSIGSAFYQNDLPATGLQKFAITDDTYWVDDPNSAYYNQRVIGTENMDWNSAEHMCEIPGYKYGFVVNYNTPAEYNKGSAIFFHIGSMPTQGCIATTEEMVLAYLAKLGADSNPYILIK